MVRDKLIVATWGLGTDDIGDKFIWVTAKDIPPICSIPDDENTGKLSITEGGGSSPSPA